MTWDETGTASWASWVGFGMVLSVSTANVVLSSLHSSGDRGGDSATLVFVYEACKLTAASAWWMVDTCTAARRGGGGGRRSKLSWSVALRYVVPALLFLLLNNVLIWVVAELGAVNACLWGQLKLGFTAVCAWVFLSRHLMSVQWLALLLLMVGAALSQVDPVLLLHGTITLKTTTRGLFLSVVHSLLSAFGGVYTELVLKDGAATQSMAFQQVMLYSWGTLLNGLLVLLRGYNPPRQWGSLELAMIVSQTATGILMGWLMRYQSNIAKLFIHTATSMSTAFLQWLLFGRLLSWNQGVALIVFIMSVSLFVKGIHPPQPHPSSTTTRTGKKEN